MSRSLLKELGHETPPFPNRKGFFNFSYWPRQFCRFRVERTAAPWFPGEQAAPCPQGCCPPCCSPGTLYMHLREPRAAAAGRI